MKARLSGALGAWGPAIRPVLGPASPRRALRLLIVLVVAVVSVLALALPSLAGGSQGGSQAGGTTATASVTQAAGDIARATGQAPTAADVSRIADALRKGPVYVDPAAASQLSGSDAAALADKIKKADKPVFLAVLPAGFPTQNLFRDLRTETGITGVYGIRLGNAFDARADGSVLSGRAVANLVGSVQGQSAATQLNSFADQAIRGADGSAPSSWDGGGGGAPTGALIGLGALIVVGGGAAYTVVRANRRRHDQEQRAALEKLRVVVDEDITAYGEELDRLDFSPAEPRADDAMRGDYEHALDAYDRAKTRMAAARRPQDVRGVTEALEDGRFSLTRLDARRARRPLPERRPPCFFDPRHGPSVTDARWSPPGGTEREVPVCAADETRLLADEEPAARTVETAQGRRPYWEAGPAYGPWAGGYFGGGLLPGLLVGTLLGSMMATPGYAADYGSGYGDFGGPGYDGGSGGDYSGGDFDQGDFGGGFGDGGGGFGDGGGFGGGGDFGGGGGF
ncbi:hypothetical protein GCM10018793_35650 [Streptomyces sulfonofaciens]|uniref:Uncharacterized protein n=1 Tax=Streptomyces sulfonofaciens TaxID=68272 RepID=A0A919G9C7_9ACTN|nr:hypothetical protein [Streptomyces sulfonofaciens]GHH80492.1 hypothetical protein GCM10018793_35650 [Streptomyces sulfonofaciens]